VKNFIPACTTDEKTWVISEWITFKNIKDLYE